ncbi:MAG: hypothetical protein OHK0018_12440 [Erythrobacter tepidarius]
MHGIAHHYGIRWHLCKQLVRVASQKKWPARRNGLAGQRRSARSRGPDWEREERGPVQELVAQAAFEIFSAATLTRFEIGAKASL